jgi:hypothetical protein
MIKFAIGYYGADDWRLVKWDGDNETEIGSGWTTEPSLDKCLTALMDHHATGNQPFSSREGTIESLLLANQWPLPTHDRKAGHEFPWNR